MLFTKLSLIVGVSALALSAATVVGGGMASIRVQEVGPDGDFSLRIPIPGVILEAGIITASFVAPDEALEDLQHNLGDWSGVLSRSVRELDRLPDMTLVKIEDDETTVTIAKRHGHLVVEVDDPETSVYVRLPTRSLRLATNLLTS